jgi:hypothetical protein
MSMREDDDVRSTAEGGTETRYVGARMSGDQAKTAAATFRRSTTAGAGLGKLEKKSEGMPKQEPGESPSAYGARLRKYREENPAIEGQKKALMGMK